MIRTREENPVPIANSSHKEIQREKRKKQQTTFKPVRACMRGGGCIFAVAATEARTSGSTTGSIRRSLAMFFKLSTAFMSLRYIVSISANPSSLQVSFQPQQQSSLSDGPGEQARRATLTVLIRQWFHPLNHLPYEGKSGASVCFSVGVRRCTAAQVQRDSNPGVVDDNQAPPTSKKCT